MNYWLEILANVVGFFLLFLLVQGIQLKNADLKKSSLIMLGILLGYILACIMIIIISSKLIF
jgi:hypothetical protein